MALPRSAFPLALLVLINLFNYVDRQVLAAVEGPIRASFGVDKAAMGRLVTAFLLAYMVLAPLFGWWADRGSRWKLIGLSLIVQSFASGGSGLAGSYLTLLLMRCVVGVGEAAYGPAAPALLSDMYPVERRGRILAYFYTAIPVGSALGYAIGAGARQVAGVDDPDSWRWAFYALMPPGVVLGIICFFMRDPPRGPATGGAIVTPRWADYVGLFRIRSYVVNSIGMTLMTFAIGGLAFWMPTYLEKDRPDVGMSATGATMLFGIISATAGLGATLAGGAIGDRLRARVPGSYFHVCGVGMLAGFPLFLLLLVTPFPYAWGLLFAAVFCLFLNTGPGNTILANVVSARVRGSAFALNIFIIHLFGDALSPWLIGAIADRYETRTSSGLNVGFVVVSLAMAVGGLVWWTGAKFLDADTRRAVEADAGPEDSLASAARLP